jgi:PHD/YefM family antitoxin component YafN of YafNO toxin-antitoxin module
VLEAAADEPVFIEHGGHGAVLVSVSDFEEAQVLLHNERVRQLRKTMKQASQEARANGFTEEMLPGLLRGE